MLLLFSFLHVKLQVIKYKAKLHRTLPITEMHIIEFAGNSERLKYSYISCDVRSHCVKEIAEYNYTSINCSHYKHSTIRWLTLLQRHFDLALIITLALQTFIII